MSEMVELDRGATAAWKIRNLDDFESRLERAARRVDEESREHDQASLTIYEAALMQSGRPTQEVRDMVRSFRRTFDDPEEELTIPRLSGMMNVEGVEWFFGDEELRRLTGKLLGQFQHRVAQYNYLEEEEVLKRWADSYDTRLFIRRRIYDTEPVVGVVAGFDLKRVQYLRAAAGANTLVPSDSIARSLRALGSLEDGADEYETLAAAESLALHLDLPAPVVGSMLEGLDSEGATEFPEPPAQSASEDEAASEEPEDEESSEEQQKE